MKKTLIILVIVIGFILSLLPAAAIGNSFRYGPTKVYISGNEIIIEDFRMRETGFLTDSQWLEWNPDFPWAKVDRVVYNEVNKTKSKYLWIVVKCGIVDEYGNRGLDEPITIGKVDVLESKKYVDFDHWCRAYSTHNMWLKDKEEYLNEGRPKNKVFSFELDPTAREDYGKMVSTRKVYKPKSIR